MQSEKKVPRSSDRRAEDRRKQAATELPIVDRRHDERRTEATAAATRIASRS